MLVTDGEGKPLSLYVESAQPNERQLVEVTLARLRVPSRTDARAPVRRC